MKVLIVKLSAFGDIIHALPVIDDLQRRNIEVHWLIDERFAFVGELFPASVQLHRVALKGEQPFKAAREMVQLLRGFRFDAVIDLQGLIKSGLMAYFSAAGAPIYGFDDRESPEWPNHWLLRSVRFHSDERHVVQKYRRIARAVFDEDWRSEPTQAMPYVAPKLAISERQHLAAAPLIQHWQQPHTLLHVGGGWQTKRMEIAQWRACMLGLFEHNAAITLSWGSEEEYHRAQSIADCFGMAEVLTERLNIHALTGMLHAAQTVIGMDTGVLHLAAAIGTPTITLWGPSASWNAGPKGHQHRYIESNPPCGPCFKRHCDRFVCLPSVKPEAIIQAWKELQ